MKTPLMRTKLSAAVLLSVLALGCSEPALRLPDGRYNPWALIRSVSYGGELLANGAMLVIALTIIRRRRLDAALLLSAAAILRLVATLIWLSGTILAQRRLYDPYQYWYVDLVQAMSRAVPFIQPVAMVLLLAGIVRTAAEPSQRRITNEEAPDDLLGGAGASREEPSDVRKHELGSVRERERQAGEPDSPVEATDDEERGG